MATLPILGAHPKRQRQSSGGSESQGRRSVAQTLLIDPRWPQGKSSCSRIRKALGGSEVELRRREVEPGLHDGAEGLGHQDLAAQPALRSATATLMVRRLCSATRDSISPAAAFWASLHSPCRSMKPLDAGVSMPRLATAESDRERPQWSAGCRMDGKSDYFHDMGQDEKNDMSAASMSDLWRCAKPAGQRMWQGPIR